MGLYVVKRFIQAIPTLIGLTLISFLLVHIVPGGPAQAMLGPKATPARVAAIDREFGLNHPLYVQYYQWVVQLLHGNLGISYFYNQTVAQLFAITLPRTLAIVGLSLLFSHVISILMGSIQAYWRDTWFDHAVTSVSYFLYSMPTFWLAIVVLVFFAINLNLFPSGGISDPTAPQNFGNWLSHITLPVLTYVIGNVAGWGRFMRTSMIDSLVQDYIRTARAKGVKEFLVVFKHALRNSVLPLITLFGYNIPALFSGALFIEYVFNYPGMGLLLYNAAIKRDYPIVMAGVLVGGVLVIAGNLIADLLYGLADPRIRYD
jgi:peptide/nickel transport system permease protein